MFVISTEQHCRIGWIEKIFKNNLNSHVGDNPQDETIKPIYSVCFSGAQTLSTRSRTSSKRATFAS